jgi:hypothetical protein
VSNNTELKIFGCSGNQLSADAINRIFTDLPDRSGNDDVLYSVRIYDNPGTATCDRDIAVNKNWWVY